MITLNKYKNYIIFFKKRNENKNPVNFAWQEMRYFVVL